MAAKGVKSEEWRIKMAETRRYLKNQRLKEDISDEERKMLQLKVRLDDGTLGDVVTFYKSKNGALIYECQLCSCFGRNMEYNLFMEHYKGKKHEMNLRIPINNRNKFILKEPNNKLKQNLTRHLAKCAIQDNLDTITEPVTGLEYLLEVTTNNAPTFYLCLLCNKYADCSCMLRHIVSTAHHVQYVRMFFRNTSKYLESKVKKHVPKHALRKVVELVASKIEQTFGRLKPKRVTNAQLTKSLENILNAIDTGPHFWENIDEVLINDEDVKNVLAGMNPVVPDNQLKFNSASQHNLYHSQLLPNETENIDQFFPTQNNRQDVYKSRFNEDGKRFNELSQSDHHSQLNQNYMVKLQQLEADLMKEMAYYQQNPEKHPRFECEGEEYWTGRVEDLKRKGEDYTKVNIVGEFRAFWDVRLRQMFEVIFEKEKAQLRAQFEALFKDHANKNMTDVQDISKIENYNRSAPNKRHYESIKHNDNTEFSEPSGKRINLNKSVQPNSEISVIQILRQLTVLEGHLGSLGPKVVNLLSEAIAADKSVGAASVLLAEENCTMLSTVKEKLIGLLEVGLVQDSMKGVTEKAVHNITTLLNTVPRKSNQSFSDDKPSSYGGGSSHNRKPDLVMEINKKEDNYYEERKVYLDEKKSYPLKNKYQKSYPNKNKYQKSYPNKNKNQKSYPDESKYQNTSLFNDYQSAHGHYSQNRIISQNIRSYKISEINNFVEKLDILKDFTFLEKMSVAQKIASTLIFQNQTEITENRLLEMIKTYTPTAQEQKNKFSMNKDDYYNKQSANNYQQQPNTSSFNENSSLGARDKSNQGSYSSFANTTGKSHFPGYGTGKSDSYSLSFANTTGKSHFPGYGTGKSDSNSLSFANTTGKSYFPGYGTGKSDSYSSFANTTGKSYFPGYGTGKSDKPVAPTNLYGFKPNNEWTRRHN